MHFAAIDLPVGGRRSRRSVLRVAALALLMSSTVIGNCGAASKPPKTVAVQVLHQDTHCDAAVRQPEVRWLRDAAAWRAAVARLRSRHVNGGPQPAEPDWSRQLALVVAMGQRPTAGYGVAMQAAEARLDGAVLELSVVWQEPPPDAMVAQVVTHPCLWVRLPKGSYSGGVRVRDQNGVVRIQQGP